MSVLAHPLPAAEVAGWLAKGVRAAAPLVDSVGAGGRPGPVRTELVAVEDAEPGGFMPCWPEDRGEHRVIYHLPDAGFFLAVLQRSYAPVLARHPELAGLLWDGSRAEVAVTNDVLQAQLVIPPLTMVRHHALMLLHGMLWLAEPARSGWARLYRKLAGYAVARYHGPPPIDRLARVEEAAFADFARLAPGTRSAADAAALLAEPAELDAVLEYQLLAAVAVYVLWRDHESVPAPDRPAWQRRELTDGYHRPDYLTRRWTRLLAPLDGAR